MNAKKDPADFEAPERRKIYFPTRKYRFALRQQSEFFVRRIERKNGSYSGIFKSIRSSRRDRDPGVTAL
jgi:hypothetical protein